MKSALIARTPSQASLSSLDKERPALICYSMLYSPLRCYVLQSRSIRARRAPNKAQFGTTESPLPAATQIQGITVL
jgi:hypothetical protein